MVEDGGKMKNNHGQALIEFILIVPVLVMFILGIFDVGNIIYKKYQLENHLDYIIDLYEENKTSDIETYIRKEKITMNDTKTAEYTTITITKNISFVTPGASKIFGSSYKITTKRTIKNES